MALRRGPHPSANHYADFIIEEFVSMIRRGHWCVLPSSCVHQLPNLRLSPLGVVPQRERRPRIIVDYTFSGVNQDTVPLAPSEAMQFGRTLFRLLHAINDADPAHGPVFLSKLDIADGFYRLWLSTNAIPTLGVLLPALPGFPSLVAFPLVLPMGWANSPPFFCSATETVADLANRHIHLGTLFPDHPLEEVSQTQPPCSAEPPHDAHPRAPPSDTTSIPRPPPHSGALPLAYVDVYVDDFLHLAQGLPHQLLAQTRLLLHTLDSVLRPRSIHDSPYRQDPASVKKFLKGDGVVHSQTSAGLAY